MKRHDDGEARVIPVILRPVDLKGVRFGKLQALPKDARPVTDWPNRDEAFLNVAQGIRVAAEELVLSQIKRLFESLDKVERLKNWPNVISLGERILASLPDHLPEYQTARSKTAAAYVKRWSRCFDESLQDVLGRVQIKTKRNEDEEQIRKQIMADLDRAIELDPEVGEYYYLRYSMRRLEFDYDCEGDIELDNIPYRRESVLARESDLARAIELDPSISEALRDLKRSLDSGHEELRNQSAAPAFNWEEFLANTRRPMKVKERWRLKCLRD